MSSQVSSFEQRLCRKDAQEPKKETEQTIIEERLNTLIESLQASGGITSALPRATVGDRIAFDVGPATSYTTSQASYDGAVSLQGPSTSIPATTTTNDPIWIPDTYNCHGPRGCICGPTPGQVAGAVESDEEILEIYRNKLLQPYPFVTIPQGLTAKELQATWPFLMSCVRMVACFRSRKSMQGQMYRLMSHIAEHMLMRSERSLDLLSGIVVILGWYHHHCFVHAQMNNLISLAVTLTAELGLKRSPSWQERTKLMVVNLGEVKERTNEERRLLLAVWYLSSCISIGFQQIDSMNFSPYIKQCLRDLERAPEFESDQYLVHLIRIQELSERIAQLRLLDEADQDSAKSSKAPLSGYMCAFETELEEMRSNMPQHLRDNPLIKTRLSTTYLRLHEPPNLDANLITSLSKSLTTATPFPGRASPLDGLYRSSQALKAWFEDWFSFPVSNYPSLPLPVIVDMTYAITILGRWAKLVTPGAVRPAASPLPVDPSGSYNSRASEVDTPGSEAPSATSSSAEDRKLVQSIIALKARLATQPGLNLDVTGLLDVLGSKLEQASEVLAAQGEDHRAWERNVWKQGAIKVRIAQLKLEQWSEMVDQDQGSGDTEFDGSKNSTEGISVAISDGSLSGQEEWALDVTTTMQQSGDLYRDIDQFLSTQVDQDWGLAVMGHWDMSF
ncbi:hypothetical protein S7711_09628 [Stachybotrys chartarum IBT 7711]|uniref:Transcription factor domain-containing protein n=1 Tax=Stachybotrys chartarum (strain CBS 109288 / IBT 7711) TaxID=1280523 RepID=A0A084B281_STACB|nr:hypothetical protein S7711_09628 [Stachybotrys chartarum IBT 7711]